MEKVQKLKQILDERGIKYTPASDVAIKDIVERIDVVVPDEVIILLRTLGSFNISDGVNSLGLDTDKIDLDMYLRYMILTNNSIYSKFYLPIVRLGDKKYLVMDCRTKELVHIDMSNIPNIVTDVLETDIWDTILKMI